MDFTVSVSAAVCVLFFRAEIIGRHSNHHSLLLKCVDVFDDTTRHQILPTEMTTFRHKIMNFAATNLPVVVVISVFEHVDVSFL